MGIFQSKPKGPPAPVDMDAPMSQWEIFQMVRHSHKHVPFKRMCCLVPSLSLLGLAVSVACSVISVQYGEAVVGDIGWVRSWYIVTALVALLWTFTGLDFAYDTMSLNVLLSVKIHITRLAVANLVTCGLYFYIYYQNQKSISDHLFPSDGGCTTDCANEWAVYEFFSLVAACVVLALGIVQMVVCVLIFRDPILRIDFSKPPPDDDEKDKEGDRPKRADSQAKKGHAPPARASEKATYHPDSDLDSASHLPQVSHSDSDSDDAEPLMRGLAPTTKTPSAPVAREGIALQLGKRRSTGKRVKEQRRRERSRVEGVEEADRDVRKAERKRGDGRGVYDRV